MSASMASMWVDKYRPNSLDTLDYHDDLTNKLRQMAATGDFPHVLFYGPSGAGKKTRVTSVLRELFGSGAEKLKIENRSFTTSSNKKLDIHVVSSNYHVEITPSDLGNYDRVVIQELIKDLAQTKQLDAQAKQKFKIVVFNEADTLSRGAQAALRRTMEKYMGNMRVILCCNVTSKIIAPIRSRCLMLRVSAPSIVEMCRVLQSVALNEKISLPDALAKRIATSCAGNMRKALLMMEACYVQHYPFTENQALPLTDWELFIKDIAKCLLKDQTPKCLQETRTKLYSLLSNCIPADIILKKIAFEFMNSVDAELKPQIIGFAAEYEHRMRIGSKAIFHLEGFCAKLLSTYATYLMSF